MSRWAENGRNGVQVAPKGGGGSVAEQIKTQAATQDDYDFLLELTRSFTNRGSESVSVKDWMQPDWDAGIVAVEGLMRIGAAWWRSFGIDETGEPFPDVREVFVAVLPEHRGNRVGPTLFDALLMRARASDVRLLVARPVRGPRGHLVRRALSRAGFQESKSEAYLGKPEEEVAWVLNVQS